MCVTELLQGELAAAEVGGFYEDVVARHASALEAEAALRLREEARANAAAAELAAVQHELELLRARTAAVQGTATSRAHASPPPAASTSSVAAPSSDVLGAARSHSTPGSAGFAIGTGNRTSASEEIEYMRLHYESELALAAQRAEESQVSFN